MLPLTTTGARTDTSPSSDDCCGASTATTPVGSGAVMSKYGPATGFRPPSTWAILSDHPAYQTHRSIACDTNVSARARGHALGGGDLGDELGATALHQLGHAVEHLAAVVRRRGRPATERTTGGDDRVAGVLARAQRGVGEERARGSAARTS